MPSLKPYRSRAKILADHAAFEIGMIKVRGKSQAPEVSLNDGYMAVIMGMAAQISMKEHRAVEITELTRAMNG